MAKKPKVNKTQAVKDFLKDHPGAVSSEIAAALTKRGVKITANYVSNIKTTLNKAKKSKKAAKKVAAHVEAAPVTETPTKNGGTLTLEQVKKVAHTIRTLGGYQRVTEVLEVIKELGGVKKFRDLAEAMTVTDTDAIPY
jgi:arginine repressor